MRKHYPLNSQGAEDAGQLPWKDGVPSTGVEGSYPGQALFVDTEAEILAAIDAAGLVRSGSDLTQLIQAASRGIWLGQFGGTATALVATIPSNLVIPSLQAGVRVRGIAGSNYPGGGGTLAITGVGPNAASVLSCPIVGSDGASALTSGAWKAGQFLTFEIDASGNARFGGSGAPSVSLIQQQLQNFVILADQKPNLTPGGVFVSKSWRTRDLNTVLADPQGLTSGGSPTIGLASNQVTLQPGTYIVQGSCPALTGDTHKTRFQNITDGVTAIWGTSENGTGNIAQTPDSVQTRSQFLGTVALAAVKTFQIQHICATTSTGDLNGTGNTGFGCPATYNNNPVFDGVETYTLLTITKVG